MSISSLYSLFLSLSPDRLRLLSSDSDIPILGIIGVGSFFLPRRFCFSRLHLRLRLQLPALVLLGFGCVVLR